MKSKAKKHIGRIALGLIFLLNPNITVVDLIPDFIGCLLIISGLSCLRDISDSLEEARRDFLRLFWVSMSHIPAFVLMIFISSSFVSEKTSILVFTFVYAVIEFVLINNALTSLIDGFVYIGERYNGDCCFYESKKNGKRIDVSHLRVFTTVFLVVTKAAAVLPNLVYLYDTSLGYGTVLSPYVRNPVEFIGLYTAICFIPALVLGIIWARRAYRYVRGIQKDEAFISVLDEIMANRAVENTATYKFRRTATVTFILYAAAVLCADMYIDEMNIIPDVICASIFLAAAVYMRRRFPETGNLAVILSSVYMAAQTCMFAIAVNFNLNNMDFWKVGRADERVDRAYLVYLSVLILCEVLFVATVAAVMRAYSTVLSSGFKAAVRPGHMKAGKDVFFESHKRNSLISVALALVCGVCHVILIFSMGNMRRILLDKNTYTDSTGMYVPALEGFWMVNLIANIVFISFVCYTISKSKEELKERLYII